MGREIAARKRERESGAFLFLLICAHWPRALADITESTQTKGIKDRETPSGAIIAAFVIGACACVTFVAAAIYMSRDKKIFESAATKLKKQKQRKRKREEDRKARRRAKINPEPGAKRPRPQHKRVKGEVPGEFEARRIMAAEQISGVYSDQPDRRLKAVSVAYGDLLDGKNDALHHHWIGDGKEFSGHDYRKGRRGKGVWDRGNLGRKNYHPDQIVKHAVHNDKHVRAVYAHTGIADRY